MHQELNLRVRVRRAREAVKSVRFPSAKGNLPQQVLRPALVRGLGQNMDLRNTLGPHPFFDVQERGGVRRAPKRRLGKVKVGYIEPEVALSVRARVQPRGSVPGGLFHLKAKLSELPEGLQGLQDYDQLVWWVRLVPQDMGPNCFP